MNQIKVNHLSQLEDIESASIALTGQETSQDQETYENMWAICFDQELTPHVTYNLIYNFIMNVIKNKQHQVSDLNIPATFYMWYDIQALELRFNILSGTDIALPFGCKTDMQKSPKPIIEELIHDINDDCITWNELEPVTEEDEEESTYTIKIYFTILQP